MVQLRGYLGQMIRSSAEEICRNLLVTSPVAVDLATLALAGVASSHLFLWSGPSGRATPNSKNGTGYGRAMAVSAHCRTPRRAGVA
jgi:hypothetical protein